MSEPLKPLRYAKVDYGPPEDWMGVLVLDVATGEAVKNVVEVDCDEGWLLRCARDSRGFVYANADGEVTLERLEGRFVLVR
jgi:hypothetical protein